jgi:flagellar hook protein FlgE
MSIIGAFIAGVTGIDAQGQKLGAVSDNIANANTVGYKPTDVLFKTLVIPTGAPQTLGSSGPVPFNYAPGGVIPTPESRMDLQGLMTASSSSTDIAISGRGFFPVTPSTSVSAAGAIASSAERAVTRAGSFTLDKNGFLVNSAGFTLLGVAAGSALPTKLTGLVPVQLTATTIAGGATSTVALSSNLPATATAGTTEQTTVGVFDSAGNKYSLGVTFTNTGQNTWTAAATSITAADSSGVTGTVASSPLTLSFDSNGQLTTGTSGSLGTVSLSNGQTISPTFSFSGTTQFGGAFATGSVNQNGFGVGSRTGVNIDSNGIVSEVYSNGQTIARYQVPVITYNNPQGLQPETGNVWLETQASGTATVSASNTNGAGLIMPSELEQSAVDLSTEFQNMIISQKTYQANTKTITTADQMYETIAQLR